jgi:hypothetical protein
VRNNFPAELVICSSPRHGLATTRSLRAAGLSYDAIRLRVKRGALVQRYPGVYSFGRGDLSPEAQKMAAVLAGGPGAVAADASAASLYRISRWPDGAPHILVPRRHRPIQGILVHQCLRLDARDVAVARDIPVTTVARTLVDLGVPLTPHQLCWVINEAAFRRKFDLGATRRAMERANGHHGIGTLKRALALYAAGSAGTKSRYEDAFLAVASPEPLVNMQLLGYEVDFHWPGWRLVVEVDGNHSRPRDVLSDDGRDAVLRRAGWTVVRLTGEEVEYRAGLDERATPDRLLGACRARPAGARP